VQTKRILLVEDNPKDIELTLAALEHHRLANGVVVARDGVEALDYLRCTYAAPENSPAATLTFLYWCCST